MRNSAFRFKRFNCSHSKSSLKIGVDAVLLGAWADVSGCQKILDVGTGCGVIALMCAQRADTASQIIGIDIDADSIKEAGDNFNNSPWATNLKASLENFNNIHQDIFDLIISNPPYFNSGIDHPDSSRLIARHEGELSPATLLKKGKTLLKTTGRIAMIIPYDRLNEISDLARDTGFITRRGTIVKGNLNTAPKRVLLEFEFGFGKEDTHPHDFPILTLEIEPGVPTPEYKELCADFYLKF